MAGSRPTVKRNDERSGDSRELPHRLYAADCFPGGIQRLNLYAKANVIGEVVGALEGYKELEQLRESQFGGLLKLPVSRSSNSAKLIHALFARQLVTKKKYEMWAMFGPNPIRFSLAEFKRVTGLYCGKIPEEEKSPPSSPSSQSSEEKVAKKNKMSRMWKDLFGRKDPQVTVTNALVMLRNPKLPAWKRLPLAVIILVDGVLICRDKNLVFTPAYVDMLCDMENFMSFPWGRVSFLKMIKRFIPNRSGSVGEEDLDEQVVDDGEPDEPVEKMRNRLKQQTNACYGFPLALQLLALETIPLLASKVPDSDNPKTFLNDPKGCENTITILHLNTILEVERDPNVSTITY